jgi:hypothetical protein
VCFPGSEMKRIQVRSPRTAEAPSACALMAFVDFLTFMKGRHGHPTDSKLISEERPLVETSTVAGGPRGADEIWLCRIFACERVQGGA